MSTATPTTPVAQPAPADQPLVALTDNGTLVISPKVVKAGKAVLKAATFVAFSVLAAKGGAVNAEATKPAPKGWLDFLYW